MIQGKQPDHVLVIAGKVPETGMGDLGKRTTCYPLLSHLVNLALDPESNSSLS